MQCRPKLRLGKQVLFASSCYEYVSFGFSQLCYMKRPLSNRANYQSTFTIPVILLIICVNRRILFDVCWSSDHDQEPWNEHYTQPDTPADGWNLIFWEQPYVFRTSFYGRIPSFLSRTI
ncbi:hypothetical protein GALMADRAFT_247172 [Galerina marginata CBS 339.88]|uniref:Uncharacterized protein n=1 Tax=Galerina marginata (strain CBS 339.88) TaxID=685588 RepID=A0A067TAJ1_GALM3|nr:hypothetical protein GALMADRAFT_247172 [Galerina marginata CBS 339.88]